MGKSWKLGWEPLLLGKYNKCPRTSRVPKFYFEHKGTVSPSWLHTVPLAYGFEIIRDHLEVEHLLNSFIDWRFPVGLSTSPLLRTWWYAHEVSRIVTWRHSTKHAIIWLRFCTNRILNSYLFILCIRCSPICYCLS